MWPDQKYEASGGSRFYYNTDLSGGVLIIPRSSERALVPVGDLVEFIEICYHGSELPTTNAKEAQ